MASAKMLVARKPFRFVMEGKSPCSSTHCSYTFSSSQHDEIIRFWILQAVYTSAGVFCALCRCELWCKQVCIVDTLFLILAWKIGFVGEIAVHFGDGWWRESKMSKWYVGVPHSNFHQTNGPSITHVSEPKHWLFATSKSRVSSFVLSTPSNLWASPGQSFKLCVKYVAFPSAPFIRDSWFSLVLFKSHHIEILPHANRAVLSTWWQHEHLHSSCHLVHVSTRGPSTKEIFL